MSEAPQAPILPPRRRRRAFAMPLGVFIILCANVTIYGLGLLLALVAHVDWFAVWGSVVAVVSDDWHAGAGVPMKAKAISLISYQFFHAGLLHLGMNMFLLISVGPIAEHFMAPSKGQAAIRFLCAYIMCGIAGALAFVWLTQLGQHAGGALIGASGALSGVFGGFVMASLWAAMRLRRAGFGAQALRDVAINAAMFVLLNVVLAAGVRQAGWVPIAWESHLGGFLAGLVVWPLLRQWHPPEGAAQSI